MQPENIPDELKRLPQWVCFDATKQPINVHTGRLASSTDPTTWATFDQACEGYAAGKGVGIGFVLTKSDPFAFIDLDVKPGEQPTKEQHEILAAHPGYAELSPSGRGLHIVVKGEIPSGRRRGKIEVYSSERYMTMTGNVFRPGPIMECDLGPLYEHLGGGSKAHSDTHASSVSEPWGPQVSDEQAMTFMLGSQAVADAFNNAGVTDPSEARYAVICSLAKATNGHMAQARKLFEGSPLVQQNDPAKAMRDFDNYLWPKAYGRGLAEHQQAAQAAAHGAQIAAGLLQPATGTLTLNDLLQIVAKTPPRLFTTTFLTPVGEVTLLSANGGVGKTMFALMWAICIAFGIGGLPLEIPRPAAVLFVTAEDDAIECGRRIAAIFSALHLNMGGTFAHEGGSRLHLWDIEGAALWAETRDNASGVPTPTLEELERRIVATGAQQVFIDNASSVFHANHNDLTAVNSFIGALRRIASRTGCNIVLLAHVSAENATKGSAKTYYGSAAWHNGVRSRMFMELVSADNGVPEHVVVLHEKSNYGPKAEPFKLKKNPETGVLSSLSNREIAEAVNEEFAPFVETVFGQICECFQKGNPINTSNQGSATAFKCLSDEFPMIYPEADRVLKGKVKAAISALSNGRRIVRQRMPTPDRKTKEVWVPANV